MHAHLQISNIMELFPIRKFLAIDDPRSALPINNEPADEDIIAEITDHELDVLKVIGKGTFVKVGPFLACESLRHIITLHACVVKAWVRH